MKIEIPCASEHDCNVTYDTIMAMLAVLSMEGLTIEANAPLEIHSEMEGQGGPVKWWVQLEISLPSLNGSRLAH